MSYKDTALWFCVGIGCATTNGYQGQWGIRTAKNAFGKQIMRN